MKKRIQGFIDNFEGYCCVVALSAMSIIIFIQVIFRYVLKASLPWSEEISRYLLVWTTFFGGAYGVRLGAHIGVEAFTMLLPKKYQRVLAILINVASIVLCVAILVFGIKIVQTQMRRGQLSPAMRLPMGYVYLAIPIGMVLFIVRYIQRIVLALLNFSKNEEEAGGLL
ncbi:MAG: TRAP transporter small permease [Sphaerochaeta sp.]|jgi:C4-dicarboxylate transporter DctQ subunit